MNEGDDSLAEATKCQHEGSTFSGVIYGHQLRVTIGVCIQDLEIIAKSAEPEELQKSPILNGRFLLAGLGKEKDEGGRMNLKDFRSL